MNEETFHSKSRVKSNGQKKKHTVPKLKTKESTKVIMAKKTEENTQSEPAPTKAVVEKKKDFLPSEPMKENEVSDSVDEVEETIDLAEESPGFDDGDGFDLFGAVENMI